MAIFNSYVSHNQRVFQSIGTVPVRGPGEVTAKFRAANLCHKYMKNHMCRSSQNFYCPRLPSPISYPHHIMSHLRQYPHNTIRKSQKFPRHLWSSTDLRSLARTASSPPRSLRSFSAAERSRASRRSLFSCSTEILEMCPKKTMVMFFVPITPEITMDISHYKALITVKGYNCGKALVSSNKQLAYGSSGCSSPFSDVTIIRFDGWAHRRD